MSYPSTAIELPITDPFAQAFQNLRDDAVIKPEQRMTWQDPADNVFSDPDVDDDSEGFCYECVTRLDSPKLREILIDCLDDDIANEISHFDNISTSSPQWPAALTSHLSFPPQRGSLPLPTVNLNNSSVQSSVVSLQPPNFFEPTNKPKTGQSTAARLREFAYANAANPSPFIPIPAPSELLKSTKYGPNSAVIEEQKTPDTPTPLPRGSRKRRRNSSNLNRAQKVIVKEQKVVSDEEDGESGSGSDSIDNNDSEDADYVGCSKAKRAKDVNIGVNPQLGPGSGPAAGTRSSRRLHGLQPEVDVWTF